MNRFTSDQAVSIGEARLDVLQFQEFVLPENSFGSVTGGQHRQNVFHGYTHVADDWLAAEYIRANSDPAQKFFICCH